VKPVRGPPYLTEAMNAGVGALAAQPGATAW